MTLNPWKWKKRAQEAEAQCADERLRRFQAEFNLFVLKNDLNNR